MFIKLLIIALPLMLGACSNSVVESITPDLELTSPKDTLNSAISVNVDQMHEIYAVGKATVTDSGSIIAHGKAAEEAKSLLKKQIYDEQDLVFKSFLVNADAYTLKIIEPILSDLKEYNANRLIPQATIKQTWLEGKTAYTLVTMERGVILNSSKEIFLLYFDDMINRFSIIKTDINNRFQTTDTVEIEGDTE